MIRVLTLILAMSLCLISASLPPTQARSGKSNGGIRRNEGAIAGQYIIVLKESTDGAMVPSIARGLAHQHGSSPEFIYQHTLKGFSARLSEAAALALSRNPHVEYVEEDALVEGAGIQQGASWGLDRIDQRDLPLNSTYSYSNDGAGVNVYVIDSGIRFSHQEFSGRASLEQDFVLDGLNGDDCYGHGTHVAAIIGGNTYGVAKAATLYSVRVLDCFGRGPLSRVLAGIEWVKEHHTKPAVANFSFISAGASASLDTAVRESIAAGVTCVVSAGNSNMDAGTRSPARVAEAITVGATDSTDTRAVFSNYGAVVDVFAPGADITSAWVTDDTYATMLSGTSSASAFVSGIAARLLQANPAYSPAEVSRAISSNSSPGRVADAMAGTPNQLLSTNIGMFNPKLLLDDFESGSIQKWHVFKDASTSFTAGATAPGAIGANSLEVSYSIGAWGGVSQGYLTPVNWSSYHTLDFWFYGGGTGNTIRVEISDNRPAGSTSDTAERFKYDLVDNFTGWRHFSLPWAAFQRRDDYQPAGAPNDGLTLTQVWGFNFAPVSGSGSFRIDQVELLRKSFNVLGDFEGGSVGNWSAFKDPGSTILPSVASPGKVGGYSMSLRYDIAYWGGISQGYLTPRDWSGYQAVEFWFYGGGSGNVIRLEVSDNRAQGSTTDTAERFEYRFTDDFIGWRHFCIPWIAFTRRADYQPTGAPSDGLTLTEVWGINFAPISGRGNFQVDQVQLTR